MCEHISTIEIDGKHKYLTDADIFSPFGREVLAGCKDNDYLGHGAIRAYYNIPQGHGKQREYRNFWDASTLPDELGPLCKDFETWKKNWGKCMAAGYFKNNDLSYIIAYCTTEKYLSLAWARLLEQKPSNNVLGVAQGFYLYDLSYIIVSCKTEKYLSLAWALLLEQKPSNYDLRYIITYCTTEKYLSLACARLLEQKPSNYDLSYIIAYCTTEKYRSLAKIELAKKESK